MPLRKDLGLLLAGRRRPGLANTTTGSPCRLRNRRVYSAYRRAEETQRHCLEVLHNGSEMKLVAGAGETAKAHTLKAMLDLQVRKTHLHLFARIARSFELRRT